ncbi:MAG: dTDP-4-dehydrorhamnose 3,5-epimerase family protein [Planctomycetota bacterium]
MTNPETATGHGLPHGVRVVRLTTHDDARGSFTELFRDEWDPANRPVQWNLVHSSAGALRGVHVHRRHTDYLIVIAGSMTLALHDIRPASPTHGASATLQLAASPLQAVSIPPGVCHGFWFSVPGTHIYSVTHYFNMADELGCRWNSPELGATWNIVGEPELSQRDRTAGSYSAMVAAWKDAPHEERGQ